MGCSCSLRRVVVPFYADVRSLLMMTSLRSKATVTLSDNQLQVYSAKLIFHARMEGLTYVMHAWFYSSFLVGSGTTLLVLALLSAAAVFGYWKWSEWNDFDDGDGDGDDDSDGDSDGDGDDDSDGDAAAAGGNSGSRVRTRRSNASGTSSIGSSAGSVADDGGDELFDGDSDGTSGIGANDGAADDGAADDGVEVLRREGRAGGRVPRANVPHKYAYDGSTDADRDRSTSSTESATTSSQARDVDAVSGGKARNSAEGQLCTSCSETQGSSKCSQGACRLCCTTPQCGNRNHKASNARGDGDNTDDNNGGGGGRGGRGGGGLRNRLHNSGSYNALFVLLLFAVNTTATLNATAGWSAAVRAPMQVAFHPGRTAFSEAGHPHRTQHDSLEDPQSNATVVYAVGTFGNVPPNQTYFNGVFQSPRSTGIIRRQCARCEDSYKDM